MTEEVERIASRIFLATLILASPAIAQAADALKGTAVLKGQSASFTNGLGVLDAKGRVRVFFFAAPLKAGDEAKILGGDFLNVSEAPYVRLTLGFPDGAKTAAHLEQCGLDFLSYKEMQQVMLEGAECGVLELKGDLRAGGVVQGKLKAAPPGKSYSWDLSFSTTLRREK